MKKLSAISINFDSVFECLKLTGADFNAEHVFDPSYFTVMDRFLAIADAHNIKYTVFVIAKDLCAHKDYADQIRKWSEKGHEIANHSYSHPSNLAQLPYENVYDEIKKSHDIIAECVGYEPKGFVAPAWSYSPYIPEILESLGYIYDSSLFPSFLMPLIQLKLKMQSQSDIPIIRKDIMGNIFGSRQPFFVDKKHLWRSNRKNGSLIELPLPTTFFRFPIWHTLSFMFSEQMFLKMLHNSIASTQAFYYLMHPADLMAISDCPEQYQEQLKNIERLDVPLERKEHLFKKIFSVLYEHTEIVTMKELAYNASENLIHEK